MVCFFFYFGSSFFFTSFRNDTHLYFSFIFLQVNGKSYLYFHFFLVTFNTSKRSSHLHIDSFSRVYFFLVYPQSAYFMWCRGGLFILDTGHSWDLGISFFSYQISVGWLSFGYFAICQTRNWIEHQRIHTMIITLN